MMSYSEERKPIPTVEVSQKYMAWNIKEMAENMKIIAMALKNIDSNIAMMMRAKQPQRQQQQPSQPSQDDFPPF